jgi:lipopolysaccharide transport system permease protein
MDKNRIKPKMERWEITQNKSLLSLKLKASWEYRDLMILLVRRDILSFYKQTILGPLWFLIQPIATTLIFTLAFGRLAGLSTDQLPPPLFYLAGITLWNFFADCALKTSTVFKDNSDLFNKVYFPRTVIPLSLIFSSSIRFGMQFLLFLFILTYYWQRGLHVQLSTLAYIFPLLILLIAILGLGTGLFLSAITAKYRDLAFLFSFAIQLLMYATPVILPLSAVPSKLSWVMTVNPMTHIIETFRLGFLGKGNFSWLSLGYSAVVALIMLFLGLLSFNTAEKNVVDTI